MFLGVLYGGSLCMFCNLDIKGDQRVLCESWCYKLHCLCFVFQIFWAIREHLVVVLSDFYILYVLCFRYSGQLGHASW